MNSTDVLLQQTEADILEAFQTFGERYKGFADLIHIIEFNSENSQNVNTFFAGLNALQQAFAAMIEATKIVAEIKGVELE
jgi:hypothetical protein